MSCKASDRVQWLQNLPPIPQASAGWERTRHPGGRGLSIQEGEDSASGRERTWHLGGRGLGVAKRGLSMGQGRTQSPDGSTSGVRGKPAVRVP